MTAKDWKAIGPRLKRLREEQGLTQEAVAARAHLAVKTVKNAEGGSGLRAGTLRRIEEALSPTSQEIPGQTALRPIIHPSGQVWRCPQCFNCYCLTVVACPNDGQLSPLRTRPAGQGGIQEAEKARAGDVKATMEEERYRETQEQLPDRSGSEKAAEEEEE